MAGPLKLRAVRSGAAGCRGLTQEQLAREIQTTKSAISRLENHAESITLATLEKVARALGKVVHIELS